jgi:hypothetical protein
MTKKQARAVIQKAYEYYTRIFRKARPLPDINDPGLDAYLNEQDAFVNAEIFRNIPADIRKKAV